MIVAVQADNSLAAFLRGSSPGSNVDLLLGFAARAFHRHDDVVRIRHLGEAF